MHIPRTGGTSIEAALNMLGDWRVENRQSMFGLITSPDLMSGKNTAAFLQHLRAEELQRLAPDEFKRFFRFSFVRNPWDRLVSIYSRMDPHMAVQADKAGIALAPTSFDDFLRLTENFEHDHLTPQYGFIFDAEGTCQVDFVGRFEHLVRDFAVICDKIGMEANLPHRNSSTRLAYRDYYDSASRALVERKYARDIETFKYLF